MRYCNVCKKVTRTIGKKRLECADCDKRRRMKYRGDPKVRAWNTARRNLRKIPESLNDKEYFCRHIEKQFYTTHMTWDKFGRGRGMWQVDHIQPQSDFSGNWDDDSEVEKYFGIDNLQPLWYRHNMAKSNLEPNAVRLAIDMDRVTFMVQDAPAYHQIYFGVRVDQMVDRFHREIEDLIQEMNG